jgi:cbb3-type cytochrome oxidase subunit 3
VAEWLGRALQKLLQQFESARYLFIPFRQKRAGFFMLSQEEEKFLQYWEEQRQRKREFLKKFSIGLPMAALLAVAFFINFLSGWYGKADKELRRHSSLLITILVAVIVIVVFVSIFSVKHRWDRNEAEYHRLLLKKQQDVSVDNGNT